MNPHSFPPRPMSPSRRLLARPLRLIAAAAAAVAGAAGLLAPVPSPAAVYESALEFIAYGDFDGDGQPDGVIVDRGTGSFRVGYQTSPGEPLWTEARAGGIDGVTGVAVGRLLDLAHDALALTSPSANRINLLDVPTPGAPAVPVAVSIPSVGPNLVGALDIPGAGNTPHADLYVASQENPG